MPVIVARQAQLLRVAREQTALQLAHDREGAAVLALLTELRKVLHRAHARERRQLAPTGVPVVNLAIRLPLPPTLFEQLPRREASRWSVEPAASAADLQGETGWRRWQLIVASRKLLELVPSWQGRCLCLEAKTSLGLNLRLRLSLGLSVDHILKLAGHLSLCGRLRLSCCGRGCRR